MNLPIRIAALSVIAGVAAGCAVTPLEQSTAAAADRVRQNGPVAPAWPDAAAERPEPTVIAAPLTLDAALVLAFTHNPELRRQYARLGIAHADLRQAARIANPGLSFAWLDGSGADRERQGITAAFGDLLLLPARRRLATHELRRVELAVAGDLLALAREVESAWYALVSALQVASLRESDAHAADTAAELARRYHAAGNITALELASRESAAAEARVESLRSRAGVADARERLANRLGLDSALDWRTIDELPAPPATVFDRAALAARARAERPDLLAAREALARSEAAWRLTRKSRLLGGVELGYEREEDPDGDFDGPTLALALPLFDQGQAAVQRGQAERDIARAGLERRELETGNEIVAAAERLTLMREIVDRRHDAWRGADAAMDRRQEQAGYMLIGVFELIDARRHALDAGQAWLESVRDYWIARSALGAAVGGALPGDRDPPQQVIRVADITGEQP